MSGLIREKAPQPASDVKPYTLTSLGEMLAAKCDAKDIQPWLVGQTIEWLSKQDPEQAALLILGTPQAMLALIPEGGGLLGRLCRHLLKHDRADIAQQVWEIAQAMGLVIEGDVSIELAGEMVRTGNYAAARTALEQAQRIGGTLIQQGLLARYELEKGTGHAKAAHEILDQIAESEPSLSTMAYVYRERKQLGSRHAQTARIALVSSYVLDPLAHYLDDQCQRAGLEAELYIAPFNQYVQEIFNEHSRLYTFNPEVTLLSIWLEDIAPALADAPSQVELEKIAEHILSQIDTLAAQFQRRSQAPLLITEFVFMHRSPHGILDNRLPHGLFPWVDQLNRRLAELVLRHERTYVLPLRQVVERIGVEQAYSQKLFYLARMGLSGKAMAELARSVMRYLKPVKGMTKKCVVLDLDGTLWGGIVGELGAEGIYLGPTVPGEEYVAFQRALLNLTRRGILLAICSKNNVEDVLPVLRAHPHMVLKEEHFAAMRVNWKNKAENIREIAEELNIGMDALVFIDDNPNERELVRQMLPQVLTVTPPTDPSLYRDFVESLTDFEQLTITEEDTKRVVQYQAISKRQAMKNAADSIEEYLASLSLRVEIGLAGLEHVERIAQMCGKTNQFNLTTRRYQAADIERCVQSRDHAVYVLRVRDRFVDHGLVGVALIVKEGANWRIDEWLMSCRVMGLTIEQAFMTYLVRDARMNVVNWLLGEYVPTKKNMPVKDLYRGLGFDLVVEEQGRQVWSLDVGRAAHTVPPWITMVDDGGGV